MSILLFFFSAQWPGENVVGSYRFCHPLIQSYVSYRHFNNTSHHGRITRLRPESHIVRAFASVTSLDICKETSEKCTAVHVEAKTGI